MQKKTSKKIAFFSFSSSLLTNDIPQAQGLLSIVEKMYVVKYRWFEKLGKEPADKVYLESQDAIRNADICIFEASIPSTSIGQQIIYSISKRRPTIVCLKKSFKENKKYLFLKGNSSPFLKIIYYEDLRDLSTMLCKKDKSIKEDRLTKFNFIVSENIKKIIIKESIKRKISSSELLRDITNDWIEKNNLV